MVVDRYRGLVATEPISVDSRLLNDVRNAVGDNMTTFVESAIGRALRDRELSLLLDQVESKSGRPTEELLAEAEDFWRAG